MVGMKHTNTELIQLQSVPLSVKIQMTRNRVREWIREYGTNGCYISFSGGKDSTVLLDIIRKDFPEIPAVFVNTGLEYPSVRMFAKSCENVTEIRPKISFREVLIRYGYPVISKEVAKCIEEARKADGSGKYQYRLDKLNGVHLDKDGNKSPYNMEAYKFLLDAPFRISAKCCDITKKAPAKSYEHKTDRTPIMATMAAESKLRRSSWLQYGCNAFDEKRPMSRPMSFWTEQDVLHYIKENNLSIAGAYKDIIIDDAGAIDGQMNWFEELGIADECTLKTTGCPRTGCIFCLFGIRQDTDRFVRLRNEEPKLYDYVMDGGSFDAEGMWIPDNNGLGFRFIIDWLNQNGMNINY